MGLGVEGAVVQREPAFVQSNLVVGWIGAVGRVAEGIRRALV